MKKIIEHNSLGDIYLLRWQLYIRRQNHTVTPEQAALPIVRICSGIGTLLTIVSYGTLCRTYMHIQLCQVSIENEKLSIGYVIKRFQITEKYTPSQSSVVLFHLNPVQHLSSASLTYEIKWVFQTIATMQFDYIGAEGQELSYFLI